MNSQNVQIVLTSFGIGAVTGGIQGARSTSLRYLAENAHHMPRTREGWYFYWKTKNYRVALGALKGAGKNGGKLGGIGLGWVCAEEGFSRVGLEEMKGTGAGITTLSLLSAFYRLGLRNSTKMIAMGAVGGAVFDLVRYFEP
ncbi:hypothetical protein C8J56DRAFT_783102 [Mycena floridula]|nr:hypothetical protein C8J56DRAFT_783102 [Mycena floridula]